MGTSSPAAPSSGGVVASNAVRGGTNIIGTVVLAVCAMSLSVVVYLSNRRRSKDGNGLAGSTGTAVSGGGRRGTLHGGDGSAGSVAGGGPAGGEAANGNSARGDGLRGGPGGAGVRGGGAGGGGGDPITRSLPTRNYYSIRAEQHVKRHNANLVEWYDDELGISIPFSPILFAVKQEERQAPLVLLTLRYLRQDGHHVAITIEETMEPESAESYRDASLQKIAECAKILSSASTRIGNTQHPQAEYCFVDDSDQLNYALSVFVTYERLAVTVQYMANTRVRSILPTAFYELVRTIRFSPPKPSPSYLLISEPRLGLGFRLSLDFMIHEGWGDAAERDSAGPSYSSTQYSRGRNSLGGGGGGGSGFDPAPANVLGGGGGFTPFATLVGRGARRMAVVACYEPALSSAVLSSYNAGSAAAAAAASGTSFAVSSGRSRGGSGAPPGNWLDYLEQQIRVATQRLGIRLNCPLRVTFKDQLASSGKGGAASDPADCLLVRSYRLSASTRSNFGKGDDEDSTVSEGGSVTVMRLVGSCCLQEVQVDRNGVCSGFLRDTLDDWPPTAALSAAVSGKQAVGSQAVYTRAYWGAFYIPIGEQCVSFHFVASAARHSFEEFAAFCTKTVSTVSLGNHHGQSTSLLYCNTRHEILPFALSLNPSEVVEEPQLGDPLAVLHRYGIERTSVTVRVFPLLQVYMNSTGAATSPSASGTSTPAVAGKGASAAPAVGNAPSRGNTVRCTRGRHNTMRVVEHMIRHYLNQLYPAGAYVHQWDRTTYNAMPALRLCFEPLIDPSAVPSQVTVGGAEGGGGGFGLDELDGCSVATSEWLSTRALTLEEEVGTLNPFARYYPPPPPPLSYLGLSKPPTAAASAVQGANKPSADATSRKSSAPTSAAVVAGGGGDAGAVASAGLQIAERGFRGEGEERGVAGGEGGRAVAAEGGRGLGAGEGDGVGGYPPRSASSLSQGEEGEDPLRVGVAVCCEGHVFLFMTSASVYELSAAQEIVSDLAAHLTTLSPSLV